MNVTSASTSPPNSPAATGSLLLFSIGPVQDFIAAARTTRDLWSGSYLISYLVGQALAQITKDHGPEAVVFPNLYKQPILDLIQNQQLTNKGLALTPSIPNRFLAILPDDMTQQDSVDYAESLAQKIHNKIVEIAKSVAAAFDKAPQNVFLLDRFNQQTSSLLEIHWQVIPQTSKDEIQSMKMTLPEAPDSSWATRYTYANWLMDGVKSLRSFDAPNTGQWLIAKDRNKDSLTGREEACLIAPTKAAAAEELRKKCIPNGQQGSIKAGEFLAATTLIKRFWHITYLSTNYINLNVRDFGMPNTHAVANGLNVDKACWDSEYNQPSSTPDDDGKYYAIIALDGDEMGKWMSGQKTSEGADITDEYLSLFSGMLRNFSIDHARGLVEDNNGRLLYAGGDDVLAMVPADTAVACAEDLRDAFIAESRKLMEDHPQLFTELADVSCGIAIAHIKAPLQDVVHAAQLAEKRAKNELNRAACAISLFKRSGEILHWGMKWSDGNNNASALSLFKLLLDAQTGSETLSKRFPYKLISLLEPYLDHTQNESDIDDSIEEITDFSDAAADIVAIEFAHCLNQHFSGNQSQKNDLTDALSLYWAGLDLENGRNLRGKPLAKIRDLVGLLRTVAWISKH